MHREELTGLLGNCEMECTVEIMLQKAELLNFPFEKLWVRPDEFTGSDLTGFCLLLAAGCVRPGYPNGYFWVDKELVEIMRERPVWSRMPDPPEFEEMYFSVRHEYVDAANAEYKRRVECPKA